MEGPLRPVAAPVQRALGGRPAIAATRARALDRESNPRPLGPRADTLTTELNQSGPVQFLNAYLFTIYFTLTF